MVLNHFNFVYTSNVSTSMNTCLDVIPKIVTDEINNELTTSVSISKLTNVVFSLGHDKAPGPDNWNGAFFQNNWEIIKQEVMEAVQNFFSIGKLGGGVNSIVVALIPKVQLPESINISTKAHQLL